MATGQVKAMYAARPVRVRVVGLADKPQWNAVFDHNPKITGSCAPPVQVLRNGSGLRPYIAGKTTAKWLWRRLHHPEPGELFFTEDERAFAAHFAGRLMFEPNVKANGHANKAWPIERWQIVADQLPDVIQCGAEGSRWLNGVERVVTPTFRHACAVLSVSRAFVGTEGGLHHAAAALGVPAVVLWSEFIAPDITGYASQINLRHAGEPCGNRLPCRTCLESMAAISVDEVLTAIEGLA